MTMKPIIVAAALFLGGCGLTAQGDFVREAVKAGEVKVYDAGLENAEWYICEAASVGSVKRRYAGGKSGAYNELCDRNGGDIVK